MAEQTKLNLMDLESFCAHLPIVNDSKIFKSEKLQQFSDMGLFSPIIFGMKGSEKFRSAYACIDLRVKVFNPVVYSILTRLDKKIDRIVNEDLGFNVLDDGSIELSEKDASHYGIIGLIESFNSLRFRADTHDRKIFVEIINNSRKKVFTSKIPIIPPEKRPIYPNRQTGEFMPDELNEHYIKVIKICRSIPSNLDGFDELTRSTFVSKIQLAYNTLYEFVKLKLGKKAGYYRSNLLGKRVDHSGRGVIVGDPNIPPNKIGITMRIAVRIFEPFILHNLLQQEKEYYDLFSEMYPKEDYIEKCKKILKDISQSMIKVEHPIYTEIKKITIRVSKDRVVCAKRDPALQRDSWRAFEPIIVDGNIIRINHASCEGFGADFDGDTMAIYSLMTDEATEEARRLMMTMESHKGMNQPTLDLKKDIFQGIYIMTRDYPIKETYTGSIIDVDNMLKNIEKGIEIKGTVMTVGKYLFNSAFKEYADDKGYILETVTSKSFSKLIRKLLAYYKEKLHEVIQRLQEMAYKIITIYPRSIILDDLLIAEDKEIIKLREIFKKTDDLIEKTNLVSQMGAVILDRLKKTDSALYDSIISGASGKMSQITQMLGVKGLISDANNNLTISISSSFVDGLKPSEYFESGSGARKGLADRTLKTADTGYLTRKLVYALSCCKLSEDIHDCKTTRTFNIPNDSDIAGRVVGRNVLEGDTLIELTPANVNKFKILKLRSPIFCKSREICHTCYGKLREIIKTRNIGVLSGESVGERGTQLVMRTFHTGGIVSVQIFDVIDAFLKNQTWLDKSELSKWLIQNQQNLISVQPIKIEILLDTIQKSSIYETQEGNLIIPSLAMVITHPTKGRILLEADTGVTLLKDYFVFVDKHKIVMETKPNTPFMIIADQDDNFSLIIDQLVSYLDKKESVRNILSVFNRIWEKYKDVSTLDLVHVEVLLSQILRDKDNNRLLARLTKEWNPYKVGVKSIPYLDNWKLGLMFEDVQNAVQQALITSHYQDTEGVVQMDSSILEMLY